MVKLLFVTCILAAWPLISVNCEQTLSKATAPVSSNCTTLIYKMTDCIPYLTKGGSETKPEPNCCSGYKSVVKANAECICEAIKSSASMGFQIDMSKAIKLPSACGDKSPNITCFSSGGSSEAPSKPPTPSKSPVHHHHKAPQVPAPAPARVNAAATMTTKMPAFTLLGLALVPFFFDIVA